jgi:hypothetical protein
VKELWANHKKRILIIAGAVLLLAVAGAAVAFSLLSEEPSEGPQEVTSAWPVAERERIVPKPVEPVRWPLTGLPVEDVDDPLQLRVASVKIENSPAARPQSGIQAADVVYESVTEGGITRFNALFHSQVPSTIGPVRSARLSDTYIVPQYAALFAFSGSSSSVAARLRQAGVENLSQDAGVSAPYSRVSGRRAPHNLFLDLEELRAEALRRGMSESQELRGLAFQRSSETTGPAVAAVSIPFSPANRVRWDHDPDRNVYFRINNGSVHNDALTSEQVQARNVVVLWTQHSRASGRDSSGSTTYDVVLNGSGRASVFRDGMRFDGTWETDGSGPPKLVADDGTLIRLAPGNTWFQVIPLDVNISME